VTAKDACPALPCAPLQMTADSDYMITLTVSKGASDAKRTASATSFIKPRSVAVPTGQVGRICSHLLTCLNFAVFQTYMATTLQIMRMCGVDPRTLLLRRCPKAHNPSEPLALAVFADKPGVKYL